jgi:hypothetical protein
MQYQRRFRIRMSFPPKYPSWRLNPIPVLFVSVFLVGIGLSATALAVHFLWLGVGVTNTAIPLFFGVLGACLTVAGVSLFLSAIGACRQRWILKTRGQRCVGHVTGVRSRYVPRLGPEAYFVFEYRVPESNRLYQGVSRSLSTRQIKQWRAGDEIDVWYDPNDPDYALAELARNGKGGTEWRERPLDSQQTFVLNSVTTSYAGTCIALGVLMTLFGMGFLVFGLLTAHSNQRFHRDGVTTTGSITHLSQTTGQNAACYVSYLYQDGAGASHYDEATLQVMDGRGLRLFGSLPVIYLKDKPHMNRVDLPGEQRRFSDNGTILPLFMGFIMMVGMSLAGVGWWSIRSLPFFQHPLRPLLRSFQRVT